MKHSRFMPDLQRSDLMPSLRTVPQRVWIGSSVVSAAHMSELELQCNALMLCRIVRASLHSILLAKLVSETDAMNQPERHDETSL